MAEDEIPSDEARQDGGATEMNKEPNSFGIATPDKIGRVLSRVHELEEHHELRLAADERARHRRKNAFGFLGFGLATVLVLLFSLPVLNQPIETWSKWKETGASKGTEIDVSALENIRKADWVVKPDFKDGHITVLFKDLGQIKGSLNEDSQLNTLGRADLRYYQIRDLSGSLRDGPISGSGILELQSASFVAGKSQKPPSLKKIEKAVLTLELLTTDAPKTRLVKTIDHETR